ncbi:hypothetical protein C4568_01385 [Candidatus Parcubacteria bacterium]|nr:MAG: hypothetical protein C4568_01385 [Candidatus Parcubacteria bacterium]
MLPSVIDLGLAPDDVQAHFVRSGYWETVERRTRHACTLTPAALVLDSEALTATASNIYAAVENLERNLHVLGQKKSLLHDEAFFLRQAKIASHGLSLPGRSVCDDVPPMVKIDFAYGIDSGWQVLEIDTYNPRALGTIALMDSIALLAGMHPGRILTDALGKYLNAAEKWHIIVSEKEMYYETSYDVLSRFLRERGISINTLRERDMVSVRDISQVLCIPENLDRTPAIRDQLLRRYTEGDTYAVYPPKAYLGSKAFLPYFANQPSFQGLIPATALLTGELEKCTFTPPSTHKRFILKATCSSGCKGIVRYDEGEMFSRIVRGQRNAKKPLWIIQEEIDQKPFDVIVFDGNERVRSPYYFRLTVYAQKDGVAGMKITGRPEKIVHGAPDCIQMPIIAA